LHTTQPSLEDFYAFPEHPTSGIDEVHAQIESEEPDPQVDKTLSIPPPLSAHDRYFIMTRVPPAFVDTLARCRSKPRRSAERMERELHMLSVLHGDKNVQVRKRKQPEHQASADAIDTIPNPAKRHIEIHRCHSAPLTRSLSQLRQTLAPTPAASTPSVSEEQPTNHPPTTLSHSLHVPRRTPFGSAPRNHPPKFAALSEPHKVDARTAQSSSSNPRKPAPPNQSNFQSSRHQEIGDSDRQPQLKLTRELYPLFHR
jgi:hypothetical protein